MAGLALAWLLAQDEITAIVVGPGRPEHLEPVREALALGLDRIQATSLAEAFAWFPPPGDSKWRARPATSR